MEFQAVKGGKLASIGLTLLHSATLYATVEDSEGGVYDQIMY